MGFNLGLKGLKARYYFSPFESLENVIVLEEQKTNGVAKRVINFTDI